MGEAAWKLEADSGTGVASDERREERANVYLSVDVFSGHNFWTGLTMNMCERGVFIATDSALPEVGTMVALSFVLPFEEGDAVVALAEVRWVRARAEAEGAPAGIGLEFSDLSDELYDRICAFVTLVREPLDFDV